MSCCEGTGGLERFPGTGCCGTSCAASTTGCLASEPRIRTCLCQQNVGCIDRADCGGFRPSGTAATGACPGPCQCAEEEVWNANVPPKPNCEWLTNFSELRRQWSDHGRQLNCKCCNCRPCRIAAPCKPCLPATPCYSHTTLPPSNCQECCDTRRLSGGAYENSETTAVDSQTSLTMSRRESGGGCPPPGCCATSFQCSSSHTEASSNCQPCAPSPRPILKKRSCCQCIGGYCLCQPTPRPCNCPPPVQVDARAERDCSCDCPSSAECACPPSERRFPRTKVRCPNARLCCPLPRLPPGPKCRCTKCQPCMPPPCDPCTSNKCRTAVPRTKPCQPDSPCPTYAPCRPASPDGSQRIPPCKPTTPCASCRKMAPPCRTDNVAYTGSSQLRKLNQPLSTGGRGTGSCLATSVCTHGGSVSDDGDDRGDARLDEPQCTCGQNMDGCDLACDHCCSTHCAATAADVGEDENLHGCSCGRGTSGTSPTPHEDPKDTTKPASKVPTVSSQSTEKNVRQTKIVARQGGVSSAIRGNSPTRRTFGASPSRPISPARTATSPSTLVKSKVENTDKHLKVKDSREGLSSSRTNLLLSSKKPSSSRSSSPVIRDRSVFVSLRGSPDSAARSADKPRRIVLAAKRRQGEVFKAKR